MKRRAAHAPNQGAAKRRTIRVLITAGPTREYIDPVRYISNDSSGTMGLAIARAALARGHRVTLLLGPVNMPPPARARVVRVVSARDMLHAAQREWPAHDVLIAAAAVADFRPQAPSRTKLKSSRNTRELRLIPNPDVLATLSRRRRPEQIAIGFALEDRDGRRRAAAKLAEKRLDAIILNAPRAISADSVQLAVLVEGQRWQSLPAMPKTAAGRHIVELMESLAMRKIP